MIAECAPSRAIAHAEAPALRTPKGAVDLPIVGGAIALVVLLVGLPLASVFVEAFRAGFGPFAAAFHDPETLGAIRLTLCVAAVVVAFNATFGLLAAWTIAKYRFPGKALLLAAIDLPLTVSPVVAGLAILLAVGARSPVGAWLVAHGIRIAFAPPGIALATILVTFPYVARAVAAYMQEGGRELEEAALSLGASVWTTFRRITLPNARWALLNGVILCNARAMGEFGAVSVISGHIRGYTDTISLQVENLYNEDAYAAAFSIAAALAAFTIVLGLVARIALRRSTRAAAETFGE